MTPNETNSLDSVRTPFRLGEWRVDPLHHTVTQGDQVLQLPAKVMTVLGYIARHHDRLVTREELVEAVWQGNVYVGERALNNAIWRIRRALNDSSENPTIIKTVPKTGYELLVSPAFEPKRSRTLADGHRRISRVQAVIGVSAVLLVCVAALFASYRESGDAARTPALSVLVDLPGREVYPVPSPDGRKIAFLRVTLQGERDIYIRHLEERSRPLQRVTFTDQDEVNPAWSPDGRHLAYLRINPRTLDCRVVVTDLKLHEDRVVNECTHSEYDFDTLSWSPDGRWLVHRGTLAGDLSGLYLWRVDRHGRLDTAESARRIGCRDCGYTDQEVSWSPDSERLAITRRQNRLSSDIFVFELASGEFRAIVTGERSIKGHTWYRDGRRLLFVSNPGPRDRQLWFIDTESLQKAPLGVEGAGYPAYLPDFKSVVLYRRRVNTFVSSLRLVQKGEPAQAPMPVVQTANSERSPSYDPVNDRIAYVSNASGHDELWIAGIDGSDAAQATDFQESVEDPAWSPDGRYVAFVLSASSVGSNDLKILDTQTGQIYTVPTRFTDHGPPSWSADGQSLIVPVWQSGEVNLWRISPDGERRAQLTHGGGEFGREARAGDAVYFTRPNTIGLYRVDARGRESLVSDTWSDAYGWANWDWIDEGNIIVSATRGENMVVSRFDVSERTFTPLVSLPLRTIHRHGKLEYAAPHRSILFTNRELPQIDLWLMPDPLQ